MIHFKTKYGRYLIAKNRIEQFKKTIFANLLDYLKENKKYEAAWKIESLYFKYFNN